MDQYVSPGYVSIGYVMATNLNPSDMITDLIKDVAENLGIPVTFLMGSEFYLNEKADNASDDEVLTKTDTTIFMNQNYRVGNVINAYGKIDKTYPILLGFFKEHAEFEYDPASATVIVDEMEDLADLFIKSLLARSEVRQDNKVNGKRYDFVPIYAYLDRHMVGGYCEFNVDILGCKMI